MMTLAILLTRVGKERANDPESNRRLQAGELILRGGVLSQERLSEILDPSQMTCPGIAGGKAPKADRPHWRADDEAEKAG